MDGFVSKPALDDARLYLCTDARLERGDLAEFLDAVLTNGVDIVQLRDRSLDVVDELRALEVVADACRRHRKLFSVNDRADIAVASGADILHLGQSDLPPTEARAIVGPNVVIGRSSRGGEQARTADLEAAVDYFCVGPVWATPTKPGREAIGLDPIRELAATPTKRPWFAIGGVDQTTVEQVLAAGAQRIVVVRVITEAEDPGAAAGKLARRLREVA